MEGPTWSLVQYVTGSDAQPRVGVLVDEAVVEAPRSLAGKTMLEVLAQWHELASELRAWTPDAAAVVDGASLVAPITYPPKVICAGANFYAHIKEMGIERPDGPVTPYFFFKPPTTTVIGPGAPIPIQDSGQIDWEAEVGMIVADRCRDLTVEEVPQHIAGYVVANDISAREVLKREKPVSEAFRYDWVSSKAQDGFCPLGPGIVPAWEIEDPQNLRIQLSVNGVMKQDSSTADMITPAFELVAEASKFMTLEPGDVILTGTAGGVGTPNDDFLAPGDDVVVEIEGLGRLQNPVVRAETPAKATA